MHRYRKILVALDLSEASARVAGTARELAAGADAAIIALHIVDFVPVEPMGETLLPSVAIQADLAASAHERLTTLVRGAGLADAQVRVEVGNTKAQILRIAVEENVDLIVVGSRERHGLAVLVNFTEDTLLHAAPCDLLAVRVR